jgi:hypothetical protein
LLLLVCNRFY